jgi:hypothetical protein
VVAPLPEVCLDKGFVDKWLLDVDKYTFMWRSRQSHPNSPKEIPPNMDSQKKILQYMD